VYENRRILETIDMQLKLTESARKTAGEVLLSCISVFYVCYTLIWISPDRELKTRLVAPFRLWWEFWGLNQHWAMFSPTIRDLNVHTSGTLTLQDGTVVIWEPPRMERLNLFDRFRLAKWRKWDDDWLPWPKYKPFYPDVARYVGRLHYLENNKPAFFSLHLHWTKLPRVEEKFFERTRLPEHSKYNTLFTYFFSDKDFK
jgi:hypothetical protein